MPRIHDIMSGKDRSLGGKLARVGLSCLEPVYRGIVYVRNAMFDWGIRKPKKLPRPVISVGNITTGGTGKTPMVIEIVRRLQTMKQSPAILLRGYGASSSNGDESGSSDELEVYRAEFGDDFPVIANPNRVRGASAAIEKSRGISVFVLDDAFQHRQAHRDLDLVLIDATQPFGHEHVLPRGMLREPIKRLHRASAIIVTRCDQITDAALANLERRIQSLTGQAPLANARFGWNSLRDMDGKDVPLGEIHDRKVVGVCGIGNPAAFEMTLRQYAPNTVVSAFADHHPYESDDLKTIVEKAKSIGAQAIVTTEKDWVKWRDIGSVTWPIPVYRTDLSVQFTRGGDALDALLKKTLAIQ